MGHDDSKPSDLNHSSPALTTYPDVPLRNQVREFDETLSAFDVMKIEFFDHNK